MILDFIKKCNFDETSVILQIGAYVGYDTEQICQNTKNCRPYIFESDRRNIKILKEKEINKIATLVDVGISNKNSVEKLFYLSFKKDEDKMLDQFNGDSNFSSLRPPNTKNNALDSYSFNMMIFIQTNTLDSFCQSENLNHTNLIWIDCSGSEDLVLLGAQAILKKTEYVYMKFSDQEIYEGQKPLIELLKLLPGNWMTRFNLGSEILLENIDYRNSLIGEGGMWQDKNLNEHVFDQSLAQGIVHLFNLFQITSCVDFGCGDGKYVEFFNKNNILSNGFDGNPFTSQISNQMCQTLDLSKEINLDKKYNCVMSLEVGEHIPIKYEQIFLDNITKNTNNTVILSWAIPGQGGYGHINCQTNEYIKSEMSKRGFINNIDIENLLRLVAFNTWFKHTIMVFQWST